MSPEAQRIAIAEWCGWKLTQISDGTKFSNPEEPLMVQRWVNEKLNRVDRKLPDYLNDLNSIHEVEEKLSKEERGYYWEILSSDYSEEICDFNPELVGWNLLHAIASKRAEALLRVIEKWTE